MADEKQRQKEEASPLLHHNPKSAHHFPLGWTADGLPLGHASVVGQPMPNLTARTPWNSSICACLGQNDHFCGSDLEVCLLGSVAPCVLYGSNVERLGSAPGTFANHCLPYTGLYLIGNSCFGWNCLAPLFSYPSRTAIRRKFNLEGAVRHLIGHVGAVEAFWKMMPSVKGASQHVTWQLMSSVMYVLFVKKVASSDAGYLILALMLNQYWL